ncbi:glycosyltransferase [Candidatus Nanohaloarchaea archaeon]|nr:glycosyltransferase [Candidatus Nanohaloarchaea archaeon]
MSSDNYRFAGFETNAEKGSIPYVTREFYKSEFIEEIELNDYKMPLGETLKVFHRLPKKANSLTDFDAVIFPSLQYAAAAPYEDIFSVFYIHDLYGFTKEKNILSTLVHGKALQNISNFDLVIANSNHTRNNLESILHDEVDIEVVEPGIDSFYLENCSVQRDEEMLLYVGSFQDRKNTDFLLDVLDKLPSSYELICAGRYYSECKKNDFLNYAEDKGVNDRVSIIGECSKEKLRELYSSAGFYFHPAKKGGWEITPLEASACGARVIVNSSIPSVEALDRNHIVFDQFDSSGLAEKIEDRPDYGFDNDARTWHDAREDLSSKIEKKLKKKP